MSLFFKVRWFLLSTASTVMVLSSFRVSPASELSIHLLRRGAAAAESRYRSFSSASRNRAWSLEEVHYVRRSLSLANFGYSRAKIECFDERLDDSHMHKV
jgi:hypothetical protein